jgi:hypothetical protein
MVAVVKVIQVQAVVMVMFIITKMQLTALQIQAVVVVVYGVIHQELVKTAVAVSL